MSSLLRDRVQGALRRFLAAVLPENEWTAEFLEELDRDLHRRTTADPGFRPTLWFLGQLLAPATIGFVRAARARQRRLKGPMGDSVLTGLIQDIRHAWRGIVRDRWAAALIVLTLAVGIGSVSAMYGLAQRLFLDGPPHVQEAERIRRVFLSFEDDGGRRTSPWVPYNTAAAIRDGVDAFDGAAIYRLFEDLADFGDRARPVQVSEVDEHYFKLLGPRPVAGRFLQPGDTTAVVVAAPVAVDEFGSTQAALGRDIRVGSFSGTIVGVAPEGFAGPDLDRVDVWIPFDPQIAGNRSWWPIGRVADGGTNAAAIAEAQAIHAAVDPGRFFTWAREGRIGMAGLRDDLSGSRSTETSIAALLLTVVALVLLISWANVINLLLARITRRRRELLVRLALGIGRWRLARLLLAESLLLSLMGGLLSLPVANAEGALVRTVLLPGVAWESAVLDPGLMVVTFLAVVVSGVVIGLLPARLANRTDLSGGLSQARQGRSSAQARLQTVLATGQVTLSAALLLCAGLFVKSFMTMRVTDLGVDASAVHVVNLRSLDFQLGGGKEAEDALYERALETLRLRDNGSRTALSIGLPFFTNFGMSIHIDGRTSIPELPGGGPFISVVSDGYFEAIGTRIVRGRGINERDVSTGALVAVLGEATAAALWPAGAALEQCVRVGTAADPCYRVVGIAQDVHREGYREPPSLQLYLPLRASRGFSGPTLIVRSGRARGAFESTLRAQIIDAVPEVDFVEVRRLSTFLEPEIRPWRLGAVMLSMVAALAIVMSLAGVFGVLSYVVAQRRREIGVRMALGASRRSIRRLVLRMGIGAGVVGVAIGFVGVFAASRWLAPLLFETSVADPLVMVAVGTGLVGAALLACLLPAGQAARVDPVTSLRADA